MKHLMQQQNTTKREYGNSDMLPLDFEPSEWDVICQRGKEYFGHVGNRRFREAIDLNLDRYRHQVRSREEKSLIISQIVATFRAISASSMPSLSGGGFVRKKKFNDGPLTFFSKDLLTRQWYRVGDKVAREKAGQAFRDAIKTRRAIERKKVHDSMNQHEKWCDCSLLQEPQRIFQSQIKLKNDTSPFYGDDHNDEGTSIAHGFKRHFGAFQMIEQYHQKVIGPTHVDSLLNEVPDRIPHPPMDASSSLGSSEINHDGRILSQLYNPSNQSGTDSPPCFNNNGQHDRCDAVSVSLPLMTPGCKPLEPQLLSELEPRPIPPVIRSRIHDKKTVSIVRTLGQEERHTTTRIGSTTEYHDRKNPIMEKSLTQIFEQKTYALEKYIHSQAQRPPQSLLLQEEGLQDHQRFVPSMFDSDQFVTMRRGAPAWLVDGMSATSFSHDCNPEKCKSNINSNIMATQLEDINDPY